MLTDIVFMPRAQINSVGFESRIEGEKVIWYLVVEVQKPDPRQCGIIRNVKIPDKMDGQ